MRVKIDYARCQGHTMCAQQAPEIFDLDDEEGKGIVILDRVPQELEEKLQRAEMSCPERAVCIEQD